MSAVTDCQSFSLPFAAYVSFNVKIQSLILVSRWNARVKASEARASRCPGLSLVACLGGGVCTLRASWWTRLFVPKSHCSHFPQVWPRSQMLFILLYWLYVWFLTRCDCEVFNKTTHAANESMAFWIVCCVKYICSMNSLQTCSLLEYRLQST